MKNKKQKAKKEAKKPAKTSSPIHGNEAVTKALSGDYKTAVQLAADLKVTKTTAQIYLKKLGKTRKIETKMVRQGKRGPLAIGFRIRVR